MELDIIMNKIYEIRGQRVMLDFHLAELYEVKTKVLKQAVRRNIDRFPKDFMFEISMEEYRNLRSQFVTLHWMSVKYGLLYLRNRALQCFHQYLKRIGYITE
jgi:hypothetical protein